MYIAIAAVITALVLALCVIRSLATRLNEGLDRVASLAMTITAMDKRLVVCEEAADKMKAVTDEDMKAAKEAQETERRLQEGINSILNYCSQRDERA